VRVGVVGVPVTGCRARGETSVGSPQGWTERRISQHAFLLAPPSRVDEGLNPKRDGPPGNRGAHHRSAPAMGLVYRAGAGGESQLRRGRSDSRRQPNKLVDGQGTTRPSSARGPVASLPRKGWGLVNGSTKASPRSSGRRPLTGTVAVKGREARGAAERGHGQDAPSQRTRQGARRGRRLAHTSALEALGELGCRLTVTRGGTIDPACRRILGSRAQASESGSRNATATAGRPEVRATGASPRASDRRERPNPEP
jgi:hypothetical protein